MTFEQFGRDRKAWGPKTVKLYSDSVRRAQRDFKGHLDSASVEALENYLSETLERTSPTSWNRMKNALAGYFDFLIYLKVRDSNPAAQIPTLRERRRVPNPLPADLIVPFMERANSYSPMFGCLVMIFLNTGLRLSEVCSLKWRDIHGNRLNVIQKGGDERSVFLNTLAKGTLDNWRDIAPASEWVFPSPRIPGPIGRNWVWRKIRDFGNDVGIAGCRPHRLRHSFATGLLSQTGNILIVKRALGHKSIQNTEIYTQVVDDELASALESLNGHKPKVCPTCGRKANGRFPNE